jgi:tetratricopeptide (TPR) repeat protein
MGLVVGFLQGRIVPMRLISPLGFGVGIIRGWIQIAVLSLLPWVGRADDVAQATGAPPAIYGEKLAKLLTPIDDVLKKKTDYSHSPEDAVTLLDEAVTYVMDDGKRITVYHSVYEALNDAGVKALAQDTFTYKKKIQRVYLVLGQTIQPDGTKDPVKSDAVFLKTPQDQADDAIYDDQISLVSVFSNVKPGSITENISILEDNEPRIPGQYSQTFTWSSSWPENVQRLIVDLPKSFADRLKVTNLGQSVPTPTTAASGPSRQRMTWEKVNTPADHEDDSEAPADQIGPIVWLSTLDSWDAFAAWYSGELKDTDKVSPELKAKIDAWTKDAKTPEEVLRILDGHVARDVRYTGFELGKSDLQPHDCMSVWQRQYGDCKDKANLLRGMLKSKGIDAWLTLLDTEHAGAVNKANPDYRQFDHCIVNAKIGDKSVFCDPTIAYGVPGILNGSESDRDVLVIKDGHGDWQHTPPFHDAAITYTFDLKLRPNGELAGWVELKATGYYSAAYEKKYRDLSKDQILSSIEEDVKGYFPNSSVADVEPLKDATAPGQYTGEGIPPFSIRAYMTLTGVLNQGDGSSELKFPAPDALLPTISEYKSRQHTTYIWPDFSQITAKIQLPAGWNTTALPLPLDYDSPSANFQAAWTADKDTLTANWTATIKHSLFPSDEWHTLGDAITNLLSWTSKSVTLVRSKDGQAAPTPTQTDAELAANLPVMPTGEGELNLIDSEFPSDGNVEARRAALARIPTLFPSDQKTIVEATIKTAALDLDDQKWTQVISRLQPIEDANRAVLDPDTLAWADYVIASALAGEEKKDEARALFQKIAENYDVDSGRRGWAVYRTAEFLADKSPTAALDFADTGLHLDSAAEPSLYGFYASTAISNKLGDRLKDRLTKLIAAKPENLEDILLEVIDSARSLIEDGHKAEGLDLLTLMESLSDPATTGEAVAKAIKKVRDGAEATTIYAKIQDDVKKTLAQFPDIAAMEKKQPKFSSTSDVDKSISQHEDNSEANDALGCTLRLVIGYPADEHFPDYFWNSVREAEWVMRASPAPANETFFFKLADVGDGLPHASDGYADVKLLQARVLQKNGKHAEAAAIYDTLAKETDLAEGFQGPLALRSGTNYEEQDDYTKALACYQPAEKVVNGQDSAREAVLRAAFIQFDNGDKAEAFRLVNLLAQAAQKGKIKTGEQMGNVIVLAKANTTDLPAFWENWHAWWPQWQQIETYAGMEPVKDRKVIPIIPSLVDFGKDLGTAKNAKDTKRFFELMRQIAYAARFYPNAAQEFVGVFSLGEEMMPEHANDFRLLAIGILEPLSPSDVAGQRTRVLDLLVNYVDTNQNDKALAVMSRDWKPELEDTSSVTSAIHRVWGIAAMRQHQDLDKAANALENDLKNGSMTNRTMTVGVLSDIYVMMGRKPDAEKLLEAELANPAMATDSSAQQDLKTRLDNIQNASETSKQLADGVAAWLKDHQPSWWDYAEPKSSSDPRLARLDEILKNPQGEFQPAELVKAGLLAPTVASLGPEIQEQAVVKAYTTLLNSISSQDDANALAHSILDSALFPSSMKASFLYFFLLDAYEKHQTAVFDAFAKLPLCQNFPDRQKNVMEKIAAFNKVDRLSSTALTAYVQKLAGRPMDSLDLAVAQDAVIDLLQLGDIDSAQSIYQAAANYSLAPNAGRTKPEFQLTLLKEINQCKEMKPITDALRRATLAIDKPESIAKPATFDARRNFSGFGDLTEDDATSLRLCLIKTHQEPMSLGFWFGFMRDQKHDAAGYALNLSLLKAGLDGAAEDDFKATLVLYGTGVLDIDNPDVRQKYFDLLQPYRDPVKFPHTAENIRLYDALVGLRTGKAVNLETDLAGFTSAYNTEQASHLKIRALLQAGDKARLTTTLNALSADQLMAPLVLPYSLPALEAAGMKDEAALARDTLTRKLHQDVLGIWFSLDGEAIEDLGETMNALGSTQDVPSEFSSFADSHIVRQRNLLSYQLFKAYLEKDWTATAAVGTKYTQAYPDEYTAYWFLGRSLAELGKKDDAVKALTVYCQYSKDELWYPEAKALLAKLAGSPP